MARSFFSYAKRSFLILFGGIWLLVGLPFFGVGIGTALSELRLEREGTLATATITSVEQTNLRINGRPQWRIRYQFTDRQGRKVDGKSDAMSWEEVERFQEGASGKVRFDPEKPAANVWLG